jgi:hypothetical protein
LPDGFSGCRVIVAIHQPQYLPWLGYFDKMRQAGVFCHLDNVQYKKNEWQNRNRIKTAGGWQWLTVPVTYRYPQAIGAVGIDSRSNWRHTHLQALITNYRRAPHFNRVFPLLEEALARPWERISALNLHLIDGLRVLLGLEHQRVVCASAFDASTDPTGRLIDICRALGGDTYLAGAGAAGYMDFDRFRREGIRVIVQDFRHPVYPQLYGGFESHLSVVDLLFNCGPESADILRRAGSCAP